MFAKSCKDNPYKKAMVNWKLSVDRVKLLIPAQIKVQKPEQNSYFLQVKHFYFEDQSSSSSETLVITSHIAPCCNPKDHNLNKTGNSECHNVEYNISNGIHSTLFYKIL